MNRLRLDIVVILLHITIASLVINGGEGRGKGGGRVAPILPEPAAEIALPPLAQSLLSFADQRLAIVYPVIQKFKNTITSDPLSITRTWVGSDICKYKGFYCESPPDNKSAMAIASIDFNGFQFSAPTLDGFLDQLPDLALFHANSNNFSGTISPNIAKLPYLYELDLSNNRFSGSFPNPILGMPSLSFLDIRFNSFAGSIPAQLFNKDLDALFINDNNFMMRLPDNIGNNNILYLTLANNKFFGPIPRGIFKSLATLNEVLFLNNMLTGCLPYEVGMLQEAVVFDAGNNRLTGPIPFSFGCLDKLEVLNLAGNMFYGMVPEVVCALGNLANLSLSDNYFTTIGPICWSLIRNGVIDLRNNCIPGLAFQRSVVECVAFYAHPRYCSHDDFRPPYAHIPCWLSRQMAPSPF